MLSAGGQDEVELLIVSMMRRHTNIENIKLSEELQHG